MANSITKVSEKCFRVLLDALAGNASATIGFSDKTVAADLSMDAPNWTPYARPDGTKITLQQAVQVSAAVPTSDVSAAVPISIVKTGTTHADFVVTVHNDNAGGGQISGTLELYVEWAGH
jgi:hypothetical protein